MNDRTIEAAPVPTRDQRWHAQRAALLVPGLTPAELLLEALADVAAALDTAHAAGYLIPPVAAQGMASLGIVVTILHGQQAERAGNPRKAAESMAEAIRIRNALAPKP